MFTGGWFHTSQSPLKDVLIFITANKPMKSTLTKLITLALLVVMVVATARFFPADSITASAAPVQGGIDTTAIQRMKDGGAKISIAPQTGGVTFMVLSNQQALQSTTSFRSLNPADQATAFLQANRGLFGIANASQELVLVDNKVDSIGARHVTYKQTYQGLPVYGATMKVHLDKMGNIAVVNGLFVPEIAVDTTPRVDAGTAGEIAVHSIRKDGVSVQKSTLMIYRAGLAQGITGQNHLAYEIEVGDGKDSRDFVYVDAHSGKVLNIIEGVVSIKRTVFQHHPTEPIRIWADGDDPYSGTDPEIRTMIDTSGAIYDLVLNLSNGAFRSYDGIDAMMNSMVDYEATNWCPNASWDGSLIRACDGMAVDDVIAHEWGHAYTDYTHELIYQWQPGALNEAYSDIFGEIVDLINGAGTDTPDLVRTTSTCAVGSALKAEFKVNNPEAIQGTYPVGIGTFGPAPTSPITADMVLVNDGEGVTQDGCEALTIDSAAEVTGKIALVERGTCNFTVKVQNAQNAGAVGVVVYNNVVYGDILTDMGGESSTITIPSVLIQRSVGESIIANLQTGVNATITMYAGADGGELVDTVRWLMGEDASAGVMRDMWDPTCAGNPGKVSDSEYYCSSADNGGVHYNSGVPNRAFSLLVDGGTYNGQTVEPIGLTRAAAIYWRAQSVYQVPTSDFANHADSLETACTDLIGQNIYNLKTGEPVAAGERITVNTCAQVQKAMLAVEMRTPPDQCGFETLLDTDHPELCGADQGPITTFLDTFETVTTAWTVETQTVAGVTANYYTPDWTLTSKLPQGRTGSAFFALNSAEYGECTTADDQTSLRSLISPEITVPADAPFNLAFDHSVTTEADFDGGNLWVQVNGGEWALVDKTHFTFNPYNATLKTASDFNTNPLKGQPAFTGRDEGAVASSWVTSLVDLSAYARPGDKIRLAFKMGQDGCSGGHGWYVDNVRLYTCSDLIYLPSISR